MGCGGSAVMDLEPIEERANEFATWVGKFDSAHRIPAAFASAADVPALLAEVKRLTAEVQERDEWLHETAALLPEGFDGDEWEGEVIARFIRQASRPAPAWDEEAVQAEVLGIDARHHFHGTACLCGFDSHGRARSATEHITSAVLAVVLLNALPKPACLCLVYTRPKTGVHCRCSRTTATAILASRK